MIALIYFLPLVVMFVAYSVIGLTLWRRSVPGHQAHGANLRHLQAKKKVNSGGGGRGQGGVGSLAPLRHRPFQAHPRKGAAEDGLRVYLAFVPSLWPEPSFLLPQAGRLAFGLSVVTGTDCSKWGSCGPIAGRVSPKDGVRSESSSTLQGGELLCSKKDPGRLFEKVALNWALRSED